jgi:hypothetical protein
VLGTNGLKRFVDDNRVPIPSWCSSGEHVQSPRGDYGNPKGHITGNDQVEAHRSSPSKRIIPNLSTFSTRGPAVLQTERYQIG